MKSRRIVGEHQHRPRRAVPMTRRIATINRARHSIAAGRHEHDAAARAGSGFIDRGLNCGAVIARSIPLRTELLTREVDRAGSSGRVVNTDSATPGTRTKPQGGEQQLASLRDICIRFSLNSVHPHTAFVTKTKQEKRERKRENYRSRFLPLFLLIFCNEGSVTLKTLMLPFLPSSCFRSCTNAA